MDTSSDLAIPQVAPRARRDNGTRTDPEIEGARRLAKILDGYFVDPIVGLLIPGAGDVIASLLGLYTVSLAMRRKMSPVIIARMLLNLGLDALLGIVPLAGDIADFAFKANKKNLALLELRAEAGGRATRKDWLMVIGAALVFIAAVGLAAYLMGMLVRALGSLF